MTKSPIHRKWRAVAFLLISFLLLCLFLKLADEVIADGSLNNFDQTIVNYVYSLRGPATTQLMLGLTFLASTTAIIAFSSVVVVVMYVKQQQRHILPLLLSIAGGGLFATLFKELFSRARPEITNALIKEVGFSFPSGHTLAGICFYGVLAYFLIMAVRPWWAKITIAVAGVILVLGIGFSRVYLGVHWPTDVLASLALGSSWLFFLGAVFQYYDRILIYLRRLVSK